MTDFEKSLRKIIQELWLEESTRNKAIVQIKALLKEVVGEAKPNTAYDFDEETQGMVDQYESNLKKKLGLEGEK